MLFRKKRPGEDLAWIEPDRAEDGSPPAFRETMLPTLRAELSKSAPPRETGAVALISHGMRVEGDIDLPGELGVEGSINGRVTVLELKVGANGTIVGEVTAEDATLAGTVQGRVTAKRIHLTSSARVTADLVCQILQVDPGAVFEGACSRMG